MHTCTMFSPEDLVFFISPLAHAMSRPYFFFLMQENIKALIMCFLKEKKLIINLKFDAY
jgi:hypothetical protein